MTEASRAALVALTRGGTESSQEQRKGKPLAFAAVDEFLLRQSSTHRESLNGLVEASS